MGSILRLTKEFQSTHPARGGTASFAFDEFIPNFNPPTPRGVGRVSGGGGGGYKDFNPPTPRGVGRSRPGDDPAAGDFNPPTPRGVGPACPEISAICRIFQSTHPARGGTSPAVSMSSTLNISIHPSREGWDSCRLDQRIVQLPISIHPPREGWDVVSAPKGVHFRISIHPPREGWDERVEIVFVDGTVFQSTHPARGGT